MPFNFRMILSGLMAVIPDRPFARTLAPADSVTILIPNLLKPRRLRHTPEGREPEILDPHLPVLQIQSPHWKSSSTRQPDLIKPAQNVSLFLIEEEEIEILPIPGLAAGFTMLIDPPVNRNRPTSEEKKSLFWLATMAQASPGNGTVRPDLLTAPPGKDVIARFRFERGRLSTHELSERACRFQPPGQDPFEQRVAVSLELFIEGIPQQIALSMKRSGGPARTLVLAPPPDAPPPPMGPFEVRVDVMNLEREAILARSPEEQPQPDEAQAIADFEVFYDLVNGFDRADPSKERPFLVEVIPPPPPGRFPIGEERPHALCPPTGMSVT